MFLNFQTQADIRNEILESFSQLNRPATLPEVSAAIWFRAAIDGTKSGVRRTVNAEVRRMMQDGLLRSVRFDRTHNQHYLQLDLLTRLAVID